MPRVERPFTLCETVSGVFSEICDKYGIDSTWLAWQFERCIWAGDDSCKPFRISTNDLVQKRPMKEGIAKVTFEIEYDHDNPNEIKCIRFSELPSKKIFTVTQTSILHVQDETKCPLWIELPPGARKEDIGAVQALLKVDICCADWKDFLPKEPHTTLERAHLVVANGDEFWIKKQVVHKDMVARSLTDALKAKVIEVDELKKEVERLRREVDEKNEIETDAILYTPKSPARKKIKINSTPKNTTTPKQAPARAPATAPAKTAGYDARHLVPAVTPTKKRTKRALDDLDDEEVFWS